MPNEKSAFAEVTRKSKEKRAGINIKTAARKTEQLREAIAIDAARILLETKTGERLPSAPNLSSHP